MGELTFRFGLGIDNEYAYLLSMAWARRRSSCYVICSCALRGGWLLNKLFLAEQSSAYGQGKSTAKHVKKGQRQIKIL